MWAKRRQPPAGYLTERQAEAWLQAILAGDDALVNIEPTGVTFGQACAEHLRYLEHEKQRKGSTLRDYANVVRNDLVPFFGESTPVENITTLQIEGFKASLLARERGKTGRKLTHRTVQKVLVILHGVMARAKRKGWILANPCENAEKVTVNRDERFNVLDVGEVEAVALPADGEWLGNLIRVAAFTGLRIGELRALRWRHVDFTNAVLRIERNYVAGASEGTPKSGKGRSVPLSDQAMVALDALSRREHFTAAGDLVFPSMVGEHFDDDQVRRAFLRAMAAAGIPRDRGTGKLFRFHDLRHTFGTLLARNGIELLKIKAWMGHADIQTTMRYLHHAPHHDDAARVTAAFGSSDAAPAASEVPAHP